MHLIETGNESLGKQFMSHRTEEVIVQYTDTQTLAIDRN
jgi:hypothetical protein